MKTKKIIFSIFAGLAVLLSTTVVAGSILYMRLASTFVKVDYKDSGIIIKSYYYYIPVNYSEIKDVKVIGKSNDNRFLGGYTRINCEVGTYSCKELGRYDSYAYKSSTNSTLITLLSNELIVIGLNSRRENTALFNYLQSKIS
ncbi:MAG: hypothetical protein RR342_04350 [Bacilli bacterium]